MSGKTLISAVDLLRLATLASVSPEGTPDEVLEILQRTGEELVTGQLVGGNQLENIFQHKGDRLEELGGELGSDKLAKPE